MTVVPWACARAAFCRPFGAYTATMLQHVRNTSFVPAGLPTRHVRLLASPRRTGDLACCDPAGIEAVGVVGRSARSDAVRRSAVNPGSRWRGIDRRGRLSYHGNGGATPL